MHDDHDRPKSYLWWILPLKSHELLFVCYYDFYLFQQIVFRYQTILHIFQQVCIALRPVCIPNEWEDLALSGNVRIFVAFILTEIKKLKNSLTVFKRPVSRNNFCKKKDTKQAGLLMVG